MYPLKLKKKYFLLNFYITIKIIQKIKKYNCTNLCLK